MLIIPIQPVPSQTLTVVLSSQQTQIDIRQQSTGLYVDLYVNNALIIGGVIAQNANRIVRDAYLGFVGDIAFLDTQGREDPVFDGLGSRYVLAYFAPAELPA